MIPGLWDGHGHLLQYGEGIASADLFGASSLHEVRQRLVSYISNHAEAGTRSQWLRGMGWDQANFEGKWPTSVRALLVSVPPLGACDYQDGVNVRVGK